ncbi:MAG: hypothetical protein WAQ52_14400 [Terriglobales bacterium]
MTPRKLSAISVALLLIVSVCSAATLRTGNWDIIANGFQGRLNITSVDAQGNLSGTWVEGTQTSQIQGYWDEDGKRITFVRTLGNPSTFQVFTGYLFDPGATFCQGGEFRQMMAGSFEFFSSTGGKAARNVGGWAARFCVVG